jgi:hypothetical protein
MAISKILRVVIMYAGTISLAGTFYRMPLFFRMVNEGEISTIKLICLFIACGSLLVGSLRFLLSPAAKGWPFVLALFACVPVLIGLPVSVLSFWFVLITITCVVGVLAGFWPMNKQAATEH